MHRLHAAIRELSTPLEPVPTAATVRLEPQQGLQAILFDVYGTLVTSSSGDIDASADQNKEQAIEAAAEAVGIRLPSSGREAVDALQRAILLDHEKTRQQGIEYPEVDIREIWHVVLENWRLSGAWDGDPSSVDVERLALEYEMRVNPVWPMPEVLDCLRRLRRMGLTLGLISNAQFYTPAVLSALLGCSLTDQGFDPDLRFYSYEARQAKPGLYLYEQAAAKLRERGLEPHQALYVGNDMRNDIMPAQRIGFRTALFAGDARSLRLRETDERVRNIQPSVVVTKLPDLLRCLVSPGHS